MGGIVLISIAFLSGVENTLAAKQLGIILLIVQVNKDPSWSLFIFTSAFSALKKISLKETVSYLM